MGVPAPLPWSVIQTWGLGSSWPVHFHISTPGAFLAGWQQAMAPHWQGFPTSSLSQLSPYRSNQWSFWNRGTGREREQVWVSKQARVRKVCLLSAHSQMGISAKTGSGQSQEFHLGFLQWTAGWSTWTIVHCLPTCFDRNVWNPGRLHSSRHPEKVCAWLKRYSNPQDPNTHLSNSLAFWCLRSLSCWVW